MIRICCVAAAGCCSFKSDPFVGTSPPLPFQSFMQNPSDFEVHHRPSHCTASRLKVPPFSGNFSRHLSILVQPPPHIRCFAAALFSSRLCAAEPPGGAGGVRLSLKRQQKAQVASLSRRLKSIPPLKLPPSRFSLPPAAPATRRRPPPTLAVGTCRKGGGAGRQSGACRSACTRGG